MIKREFFAPSSDGAHTLRGTVYLPEGKAKGFFHIVHGMTEHIGRYDKIMSDMADMGYICFGFDNLGHGKTAENESELGFIAKKSGEELLAMDVKGFSDAVRKEYDSEGELPYFLLGHSMGSFITRLAVSKYISPDKFIIMGTAGKNPLASVGLLLIDIIKLCFGDRHISPLVDSIAFGSYNERFPEASEADPSPWLSGDKAVRERYYADKFCTFKFTVSAMGDLIKLIKLTNGKAWFKNCPKLPILLLSGENDPVGNYGRGVIEVAERLKSCGGSAKYILYADARHEILNDFTYEMVKNDILSFLNE